MFDKPEPIIDIQGRKIGLDYPTYFIADIAANHDGNLDRALSLIDLAAKAGANAAKFQHFRAETIVSDYGFKSLGNQKSHQSSWNKSVFEVYQDASVKLDWTESLKVKCDEAGIHFFTSPYDLELVDYIDRFVPAYKIGSGDITWTEIIRAIAMKNKPYFLATGASAIDDVCRAVREGLDHNPNIVLMQCNTNYTGSIENMKYVNLRVLNSYKEMFPEMILGLSDHTPGHATVLGAVALGARVIEKHFTDDVSRLGPDHAFSMDPRAWGEMVSRTRELESALGTGLKKIEANEVETVVLQRRALRTTSELLAGQVISRDNLCALRPAPHDAILPYQLEEVIGKTLKKNKIVGDYISLADLE